MSVEKENNRGPRVNHAITSSPLRVLDAEGEMVGVVTRQQALQLAAEAGLDLVEVSPQAEPPVCRIIDYGKFKYEAQKKKAEAKKKQHVVEIKEVKMRPVIDTNDYQVKLRSMERFLAEGDKVKVTIRFRGREMAHQELGMDILERVQVDLGEKAKVELMPRVEGKQIILVLAPK